MRNVIRILLLLLTVPLLVGKLQAHDVVWLENPSGNAPSSLMVFYYPGDFYGYVYVDPEYGEPCTVVVNLNGISSTLISAAVLPPNPANAVQIRVQILRAPSNHLETATLSGSWYATGIPANSGCDATNPVPFSVPISVSDQPPPFRISLTASKTWANLDMGFLGGLQRSSCITGPWWNVGFGQTFSVPTDMPMSFFQPTKQLGGFIGGIVTDGSGNLTPGTQIGLLYGGPTSITDLTGSYMLPRFPLGMTALTITNTNSAASLNVAVNNTNNTYVNWQVATAAVTVTNTPTNSCNCTPWCAIGFGTLAGGQTPVYYAGGANGPKTGTANCGQAQVTVTPPSGVSFPITAGSNKHQNSGANPAPGVWMISSTVCGQTKTASVDVP